MNEEGLRGQKLELLSEQIKLEKQIEDSQNDLGKNKTGEHGEEEIKSTNVQTLSRVPKNSSGKIVFK